MTGYVPTRVYLSRGKVAHTLPFGSSPNQGYQSALCGTSPPWFDPYGWYGTGDQTEVDILNALPSCKRCERLMK
jgi:hypothetical protein